MVGHVTINYDRLGLYPFDCFIAELKPHTKYNGPQKTFTNHWLGVEITYHATTIKRLIIFLEMQQSLRLYMAVQITEFLQIEARNSIKKLRYYEQPY